jgi:phage terminase small subunit
MNDGMEPMNAAELTERLRRLVEFVASGDPVQQAARKAGFSASYARKSSRLLKHPAIAQAVAAIRAEGREKAVYDLSRAMQESLDVIEFAKQHKNAMAYFKAVEHRAKLSGLLIDRVEVFTADLKGALLEASKRVVNASPGTFALVQEIQAEPQVEPQQAEGSV